MEVRYSSNWWEKKGIKINERRKEGKKRDYERLKGSKKVIKNDEERRKERNKEDEN